MNPNNSNLKILIIDDDEDLSFIMSEMLEEHGYQVASAATAEEAYRLLSSASFQLIILDINLPDELGFQVCKEIRTFSQVPIIFASARSQVDDRIESLNIGGDDYLEKPYTMMELLAHVNAIVRRSYGSQTKEMVYQFGDVKVYKSQRRVTRGKCDVPLSLREFDLLLYLCEHANQVLSKEEILSNVWGILSEVETQTVVVHMRWLREKLETDPSHPSYIKTVYKAGYILEI